jgi:hypothetical protein
VIEVKKDRLLLVLMLQGLGNKPSSNANRALASIGHTNPAMFLIRLAQSREAKERESDGGCGFEEVVRG